MNTDATYSRPGLANTDDRFTCPCCLRGIKLHRTSYRLARHGWRESGRVAGSYGNGFQWGACAGSGMRPIEVTDADALPIVARMLAEADRVSERRALVLADGLDRIDGVPVKGHANLPGMYRVRGNSEADRRKRDALLVQDEGVQAAVAAGVTMQSRQTQNSGRGRGFTYGRYTVTASVPRGFMGANNYYVKIASYAAARDAMVSQLAKLENDLRAGAEAVTWVVDEGQPFSTLSSAVEAASAQEAAEAYALARAGGAGGSLLHRLLAGEDWLTELSLDLVVWVAPGERWLFGVRERGPAQRFRVRLAVTMTATARSE